MTRVRTRVWRAISVRPWLTAVVVVVVGATAAGYSLLTSGGGASASPATTSRLVSATTGTVSKSISATGTFTPADEDAISFSAAAQITSVRVTQGERVTKGQVLGTINTLALAADVATARAAVASAEATLATAEDDSASTSLALGADRAAVRTARASVSSARDGLAAATLRSPITGIVAEVNVSEGDESSGSSTSGSSSGSASADAATSGGTSGSTSTGTSTSTSGDFVVIGERKWTVSLDVDDTEVGLVKKGLQAQITTDNVASTIFGTVTSVSVLSSSTSGSASYPVVVSVTGAPTGLHDGAGATVALVYRQATNVVTVPSAAVHVEGSRSYVDLSTGGGKVERTVRTGLSSGTTVQIVSGLRSGQQVYLSVTTPGGSGGLPSGSTRTGSAGFPGGGSGNFPGGGSGGFPGAAGGGS